jgi:WD40 repeat protein
MELSKHWVAQLDDYVVDLAWSPEGSQLAAASASGPIALLSSTDGALRHELPGHDNGTNVVAWSPASGAPGANPCLASGGQDGAVKFWDAAAGQHTATNRVGPGWVEHMAWPQEGAPLAAASGRKFALLHADGSTGHAFADAPKTISAIAFPAGARGGAAAPPRLAFAFFGGVRLVDVRQSSVARELPLPSGIQALVWSPDGKWLVSGNQDSSVHLWIPDRDDELQMSGFEGKVKHLSFDCTSRWLATGSGCSVSVWDCGGGGPEGREPMMLAHDAPVCALSFQRAHGLLATAAADGAVQLWSPERPRPLRATIRLPAAASKLAWSPDDRLLAIGSEKGIVYVLAS